MAKKNIKQIVKLAAIAVAATLVIGALVALNAKIDRRTTTERLGSSAYSIGALDETTGKSLDEKTSILTEKISVDGLTCKLEKDAKVSYRVFYYDKDGKFISATEELTTDFDGSDIPSAAETARIAITPTDDDDGKVSIFEKSGYAKQLQVTVSK